jgi:biofilm PGA synthesis lipoprotein PgaB
MALPAHEPHFFLISAGVFKMLCLLQTQFRWALVSSLFMLTLIFTIEPSHAIKPVDLVLKTDLPKDVYENDGISFRALCFHDVRDNLRDTMKDWPQMGTLDTYDLMQQFSWLKENGYHPVSLDAILAARKGGARLPSKAVLLTFDDGYLSVYTRVFPLLKLYNYPAVIGLVGEWLENNQDGKVYYGDHWIPRKNFVTWPQVREMAASGLVEIASHSYGLHKGETANPQGSRPPSAIARIYNPAKKRYENDTEYYARIRADLTRNSALIAAQTGIKPRAMIWPYGAYNMIAIKAAKEAGMPISMTLEAGPNSPDHPLTRLRRDMLFFHEKITDLKRNLRQPGEYDGKELPLNRVVGIDLDLLYDPDPVQQDKNVGVLVERILRLRVNMVYLKAYTDLDGDGLVDALYFPNRHLPMRSDLLNRVAWQVRMRGALPPDYVRVYVALPITAYDLTENTQEKIKDIYADAAKNAPRVAGIVFDDSRLNFLATKKSTGSHENGFSFALKADSHLNKDQVTAFKIHQPHALTVRKINSVLLDKKSKRRGVQDDFAKLIKQYDFVILSIPPDNNEAANDQPSLEGLMDYVAEFPEGIKRTIFELQSNNNALYKPVPAKALSDGLSKLQLNGARNFGYFPDNALINRPSLNEIRPIISLKTNPGRLP